MRFLSLMRLLSILLFLVVATPVNSEKTSNILLVGFQGNKYRKIIAEKIIFNLESKQAGYITGLATVNEFSNVNIDDLDIIITAGMDAAALINKHKNIPALNIVSNVYRNTGSPLQPDSNTTLLHMTQPICRHFQLIRLLNPQWNSVSMLSSGKDFNMLISERCAKNQKLKLNIVQVNEYENTLDALNNTLTKSDVLLALPSSDIYNSRTIKNILLSAYRRRVPVIGFSENFVNAGALAAVYSSPEQIGNQAAEVIDSFFKNNGQFNAYNIFPEYIEVKINRQVERSLDIKIQSNSILKKQLTKAGEK